MSLKASILTGLTVAVLSAVLIPYWWIGHSSQPLDDQARSTAPGKFLALPEGKLFYRWDGPETGPIVVMVHGFSLASSVFDHNVAALVSKGYRVLRMDNWGRGWSDRPMIKHDKDLFDHQILGALDALGIKDKIDLIGFSMGGGIAVTFAARHAERVNKLALLAPSGLPIEPTFPARLASTPVIGNWLMRVFGKAVVLAPPPVGGVAAQQEVKGIVEASARFDGYYDSMALTLRDYPLLNLEQEFERVGAVGMPVLLVWGDEDVVVPYSLSNRAVQLTKGKLVTVKGAPHAANMQNPTAVNDALVSFLSG